MKKVIGILLVAVVGLAFADYYIVKSGEMLPAKKVGEGYEPTGTSGILLSSPGVIDTLRYWLEEPGYYYPGRMKGTVVMTWFTPPAACSLLAYQAWFYSPGTATGYIWAAPDYVKDTPTDEILDILYATWEFDEASAEWTKMPEVLFGPFDVVSNSPGDMQEEMTEVAVEPPIDIGESSVFSGYVLQDASGEGKPWPLSDKAYENGEVIFTPCRSYMFRVQPGHPAHLTWIPYGEITGNWELALVINIYANPPVVIESYSELRDTYITGDREVQAHMLDIGVPAESAGVAKAQLIYTVGEGAPDTLDMTLISGTETDGIWSAMIPGQAPGTEVHYMLTATDMQGLLTESMVKYYTVRAGTPGNILLLVAGGGYYGLPYSYFPILPGYNKSVYKKVDLWDEMAYGAADSSVLNFYTADGPGDNVIVYLGWGCESMAKDSLFYMDFLDEGGKLWFEGQDFAAGLGLAPTYEEWTAPPGSFGREYLGLLGGYDDYHGGVVDQESTFVQYGVSDDPISGTDNVLMVDVSPFSYSTPGANDWTGKIDSLVEGAEPIYYDEAGVIMAYRFENLVNNSKVVGFYWPWQYIGSYDDLLVIEGDTIYANITAQRELAVNVLTWFGLAAGIEETTSISSNAVLYPNRPNPVARGTEIRYSIPTAQRVTLKVYDLTGSLVRTLMDGRVEAGEHIISWNGCDDQGLKLPSGVYFYQLKTDDFAQTRKLVLVR